MSRKDFELLAIYLGSSVSLQSLTVPQIEEIVNRFADKLTATNPRFNKATFVRRTLDNVFVEQ